MTQSLEVTSPPAPPRAAGPRQYEKRWFWFSAVLIAVANALKYPALHHYVVANAGHGPDMAELPADMVDAALAVGAGTGLALSLLLSLVALAAIRWFGTRSRPLAGTRRVLPFWLSGVATIGLVVPDLLTAATGAINPWTTLPFLLVYPALVIAACRWAPGPRQARFRLADVALAVALPFV